MKRSELIRQIKKEGCLLLRNGSRHDIYINPAAVTVGLDRLVDREIFREIRTEGSVLYEMKLGLIGLWVAKNKSLSRLYKSRGEAPVRYK